jgi:hypothetical protein
MKKLIIIGSVLACFTARAQKVETPKKATIVFTEDQLQKLFFLVQSGQEGIFDSPNISALQGKQLRLYSDSLIRSWITQFQTWNPAPKDSSAVKKDSVIQKKK